MNAGEHPTVDQIADLDAGLLEAAEATEVSAHLAGCEACLGVLGQLHEVTALLSAEGRQPLPIPAEVASSLDAALARARTEQDAGVPSLAERRTASVDSGAADDRERPVVGRAHRRGRVLLGAAAAVLVVGVGAAVASDALSGGSSGGSSQDSSAAGAAQSSGQAKSDASDQQSAGPEAGPQSVGGAPAPTPTLNASNVHAYARQLASGSVPAIPPTSVCGTVAGLDAASRSDRPSSLVEYDGKRAVLSLDKQHHRLTVFSCPGPTRVLYSSAY